MDSFPVGQVRLPFCMVCGSAPCTLRFLIRAPFEAHGKVCRDLMPCKCDRGKG